MPNMSGLEFVKSLRGRPDGKSVPVLMVTTRSVKEDILQAAQAGVNNYVVKPFTPQVLKEKIDPEKTKDYIKTVRGIGYTIH